MTSHPEPTNPRSSERRENRVWQHYYTSLFLRDEQGRPKLDDAGQIVRNPEWDEVIDGWRQHIITPIGPLEVATEKAGRGHNEDACAVIVTGKTLELIVADGMGGALSGEVAAHDSLSAILTARSQGQSLEQGLTEAHRLCAEPGDGRGATLAYASIDLAKGELSVSHLGDSPVMVIRNNRIVFITKPHSLSQTFYDRGQRDLGVLQGQGNIITRSIGTRSDLETSNPFKLEPGDIVLACSDGVSGIHGLDPFVPTKGDGSIDYDELNDGTGLLRSERRAFLGLIASAGDDPQAIVAALRQDYNQPGRASDNCTILALKYEGPVAEEAGESAGDKAIQDALEAAVDAGNLSSLLEADGRILPEAEPLTGRIYQGLEDRLYQIVNEPAGDSKRHVFLVKELTSGTARVFTPEEWKEFYQTQELEVLEQTREGYQIESEDVADFEEHINTNYSPLCRRPEHYDYFSDNFQQRINHEIINLRAGLSPSSETLISLQVRHKLLVRRKEQALASGEVDQRDYYRYQDLCYDQAEAQQEVDAEINHLNTYLTSGTSSADVRARYQRAQQHLISHIGTNGQDISDLRYQLRSLATDAPAFQRVLLNERLRWHEMRGQALTNLLNQLDIRSGDPNYSGSLMERVNQQFARFQEQEQLQARFQVAVRERNQLVFGRDTVAPPPPDPDHPITAHETSLVEDLDYFFGRGLPDLNPKIESVRQRIEELRKRTKKVKENKKTLTKDLEAVAEAINGKVTGFFTKTREAEGLARDYGQTLRIYQGLEQDYRDLPANYIAAAEYNPGQPLADSVVMEMDQTAQALRRINSQLEGLFNPTNPLSIDHLNNILDQQARALDHLEVRYFPVAPLAEKYSLASGKKGAEELKTEFGLHVLTTFGTAGERQDQVNKLAVALDELSVPGGVVLPELFRIRVDRRYNQPEVNQGERTLYLPAFFTKEELKDALSRAAAEISPLADEERPTDPGI